MVWGNPTLPKPKRKLKDIEDERKPYLEMSKAIVESMDFSDLRDTYVACGRLFPEEEWIFIEHDQIGKLSALLVRVCLFFGSIPEDVKTLVKKQERYRGFEDIDTMLSHLGDAASWFRKRYDRATGTRTYSNEEKESIMPYLAREKGRKETG